MELEHSADSLQQKTPIKKKGWWARYLEALDEASKGRYAVFRGDSVLLIR